MKMILMMYVTLFPAILAGIFNMIWCKLPILGALKKPMDGGRCLRDGKRIFGDNKTWKGLVGYLLLNTLITVLWGVICQAAGWNSYNFFYLNRDNTLLFNLGVGFLLGLGYALFELPNSFIKRRLSIEPGKPTEGVWKVLFIFLDQADSVFGCCLVVCLFYEMTVWFYLLYVLVGAVTHIVCNVLLYFMGLRKNPF